MHLVCAVGYASTIKLRWVLCPPVLISTTHMSLRFIDASSNYWNKATSIYVFYFALRTGRASDDKTIHYSSLR